MKQLRYLLFVLAAGFVMSCGNNGGTGLKLKDVIGMEQKWARAEDNTTSNDDIAYNVDDDFGDDDVDWNDDDDDFTTESSPIAAVEESIKTVSEVTSDKQIEEPVFEEVEVVEEEYTNPNGMPSWAYGKWTFTRSGKTEILWIGKDLIRFKSGTLEDTATYTYSKGTISAQFSLDNGVVTSMPLDIKNQRIEYGGGLYWTKSNE